MRQNRVVFYTVLCLLLLSSVLTAPCWAGGPVIELPETEYDFGAINEGETVFHTFKVRNTGDAPLEILKIEAG